MKTKICIKCNQEKDISEFFKDKANKDGHKNQCKKCLYKPEYYKTEEYKKYSREHYQKNKEHYKKWTREYYQKNKEKCKELSKRYKENNPLKTWCYRTITSHRKKGYEVLFTSKELLPIAIKIQYCPFCDNPLKWETGKGNSANSPTLDRVDNEKVLTLDNIQIICHKCNVTKQNRTMKEFVDYCTMVSNKFKERII